MLKVQSKLSLDGKEPSLGALFFDEIEIRALGPDSFPFGGPHFGIRPLFEHKNRFASSSFSPEIWFEVDLKEKKESVELDLKWYGLSFSSPLYFSFFIKAERADIKELSILRKTLHRYSGSYSSIVFSSLEESLLFEAEGVGKMEIIPLSGDDFFWSCDYLVTLELISSQSKFLLTKLAK